MDADSLRQVTDAIYYVAHIVKVVGTAVVIAIGYMGLMGLMVLIDTTRMVNHLKKLAAKENQ